MSPLTEILPHEKPCVCALPPAVALNLILKHHSTTVICGCIQRKTVKLRGQKSNHPFNYNVIDFDLYPEGFSLHIKEKIVAMALLHSAEMSLWGQRIFTVSYLGNPALLHFDINFIPFFLHFKPANRIIISQIVTGTAASTHEKMEQTR